MPGDSVYPELERTSNSENYQGRIEIWPSLECPACGDETGRVQWESGVPESEAGDSLPSREVHDDREPCCRRCGVNVTELTDSYRPPAWQQPFLFVADGVRGLGAQSPTVDRLCDYFAEDPRAFLTASTDELEEVHGIGETFARKIAATRSVIYPDAAAGSDIPVYPFRGTPITDTDPEQFVQDVSVHGLGAYGSVTVPDDWDGAAEYLREAAAVAREQAQRRIDRGIGGSDFVDERREIAEKLENEARAIA